MAPQFNIHVLHLNLTFFYFMGFICCNFRMNFSKDCHLSIYVSECGKIAIVDKTKMLHNRNTKNESPKGNLSEWHTRFGTVIFNLLPTPNEGYPNMI